jgi:hypothetical protein
MQILHPFAGSVTQYAEEISDPDRYRPDHCPAWTPNPMIRRFNGPRPEINLHVFSSGCPEIDRMLMMPISAEHSAPMSGCTLEREVLALYQMRPSREE